MLHSGSASQPNFNQSFKLTRAPDQEDFGSLENPGEEMMASDHLLTELMGWIDRRIDLAAETTLHRRERFHQIFQGDATDYEHVDVAGRRLPPRGHGAKHEGDLDLGRQGLKGFAQEIADARGLGHQATKLRIDGTCRVGLEVLLMSLANAPDDPQPFQASQLTAQIRGVLAQGRGELADEKPLSWMG